MNMQVKGLEKVESNGSYLWILFREGVANSKPQILPDRFHAYGGQTISNLDRLKESELNALGWHKYIHRKHSEVKDEFSKLQHSGYVLEDGIAYDNWITVPIELSEAKLKVQNSIISKLEKYRAEGINFKGHNWPITELDITYYERYAIMCLMGRENIVFKGVNFTNNEYREFYMEVYNEMERLDNIQKDYMQRINAAQDIKTLKQILSDS